MREAISNLHFIRPAALLLLPVVIGLWWLWKRRSDPMRGWRGQIALDLLQALVIGRKDSNRAPACVLLAIWVLAVFAVAGPTWRLEPSPFADDTSPLMILLKADISMESPDPAPSRLERAHLKIADIAEARKGQPLGLIAYAGSAHLVLPPTRDTSIVAKMAAEIGPAIMPEKGNRLDLALKKAQEVLKKTGQGTNLILADSVEVSAAVLSSIDGSSTHFLAINTPGSPQGDSLRTAAKAMGASVQPLAMGDEDVTALVRVAARTPVAKAGEQGAHWEEAGYWILPLIGVLFLTTFRRESHSQEVPA